MAVNLKYLTFHLSRFLDEELFYNYERFDQHHGFILDFEWAYRELFINIGRKFDGTNGLYVILVFRGKVCIEIEVYNETDINAEVKDKILQSLCYIRDREFTCLPYIKDLDWEPSIPTYYPKKLEIPYYPA